MAFDLTLALTSIASTAESALITNTTNWATATPAGRSEYGVFFKALFYLSSTPEVVTTIDYDPLVDGTVVVLTPKDGRYKVNAYAFLVEASAEPLAIGDVRVDTLGDLNQWNGATWTPISLDAAITAGKVYEASGDLEIPLLSYAYIHRNLLNLEYISQVKRDIEHGADQNTLYYKRTDLDYFYALILSAEYNWALSLYENFYQATENLNNIINTGNLS